MRYANLVTALADTMAYDQVHALVASVYGRLPMADRPVELEAFIKWSDFAFAESHPAALRALAERYWLLSAGESMILRACADWIESYFAEWSQDDRGMAKIRFDFSR